MLHLSSKSRTLHVTSGKGTRCGALSLEVADTFRFTVEQYHRMIEAGILTENDRVELLDGLIVAKMTHNPPHDAAIQLIDQELSDRLPPGWRIRIQSAVSLKTSEPEPDLAVVRGPARRYAKAHPGPSDIGLLIEVAESSLLEDRGDKGAIYARDGLATYWIVNLLDRIVEVYTRPQAGRKPRYLERRDYDAGMAVPFALAGKELGEIHVREMLP